MHPLTANAKTPRTALWLGATGAIPFIACATFALVGPGDLADISARALAFYGAIILSFLGGVQWGLAIRNGPAADVSAARLVLSVVPSLIAWPALMLPTGTGLLLMAAGFALVLAVDLQAVRRGNAPVWYPKLRIPLSLVAIGSLVSGIAA